MAAEPTRINFFRHGESISNAGAATSDPASIPLTEYGRNQAEQIAQSYEARPTLIVVSSYQRTWQTAAPVIARFPEVPVEEWPVQEFTYLEPSRCMGTTGAERRAWVEHYWKSCSAEYCDGPGAESFMDLLRRVRETRSRLEALPTGSQVAVFTHGQFLQALRLLVYCVLSASLRKPVPIGISFLPAAAEPMFGRSSTAARSPIC
jgi:broad specificity phosphatase PhoE